MTGTSRPSLYCRTCGSSFALGPLLQGCPTCSADGRPEPLEVRYPPDAIAAAFESAGAARDGGLATYAGALPTVGRWVSLGEGGTPLLAATDLADVDDLERVWLKFEGPNPTGSWKDRMNAMTVTMAVETGASGLVCSSTGNHGVSLAAYAAVAGLPAVVLLPTEAAPLSAAEIQLYGARVVVTDWYTRGRVVDALLRRGGWMLSNRNDPRPWANPFGIEGYRTISFEIVRSLGAMPDAVVVPTCGADGLYGIWKGFRELHEAGVADRLPRMIAVQPEVSASLVEALQRGDDAISEIPLRHSVALSLTDQRSGRLGLAAVRESDGVAVAVTDDEIRDAVVELGRRGVCAEPAAAASVAALRHLPAGLRSVVAVVTGGGLRWPATFASAADPFRSSDEREILDWIDATA